MMRKPVRIALLDACIRLALPDVQVSGRVRPSRSGCFAISTHRQRQTSKAHPFASDNAQRVAPPIPAIACWSGCGQAEGHVRATSSQKSILVVVRPSPSLHAVILPYGAREASQAVHRRVDDRLWSGHIRCFSFHVTPLQRGIDANPLTLISTKIPMSGLASEIKEDGRVLQAVCGLLGRTD